MRSRYFLIIFFLISIHSLFADYERRLKMFGVEELNGDRKISFILDNNWVFEGKVHFLETNKLYSLDNFLNCRVRLVGNKVSLQGLNLLIECSFNEGHDKLDFLVAPTKETYDELPTVSSIDHYLFSTIVKLSDGSVWSLATRLDINHTKHYWSVGDRVLISQSFNKLAGDHHLINLDISGEMFYSRVNKFYYFDKEQFTIEDPRNISAYLQ